LTFKDFKVITVSSYVRRSSVMAHKISNQR